MNFEETAEFAKDLKRYRKKYKSLSEDLESFKKAAPYAELEGNKNFRPMHRTERLVIVKARLFCRYLKGRTMRVIYAYRLDEERIDFIELYYKGDKDNEDRDRIADYMRG